MTKKILVRFATNRSRVADPDMFGLDFADPNHPERFVTGRIEVVQMSNLPDTGWQPDSTTLHIDGAATARAVQEEGIVAFAKAVGEPTARANRGAAPFGIVLLHGFAATFTDGLSRAAQICDAYGGNEVFVFSWPTRGKVNLGDYRSDQTTSEQSSAAVADALTKLLAFLQGNPTRPRLQLVAHSMGARALRFALQAILTRHPELLKSTVFEHTLLMASDEDDDGLADEARMAPLVRLSKHIEVYHSGGDLALALSQIINGRPRIGLSGPRQMPALPDRITSINASDVGRTQDDAGKSHFGHQYYRLSPRVISDVVHVLSNIPPDQIPGRLGDPAEPASGRSYYLPFDENAGQMALASAESLKSTETV
ncbi:alpha/beta hydrolase [Xanthobacter autotrophicus]|uniref:alpha/beta hydrolase n=1 Tax=Xanthobacter autotrophicus TaxID=280 RepID=UPI003726ECF7